MHAPSQRPLTAEVPAWEHRSSARLFNRGAIFSAADVCLISGGFCVAHVVTPVVQDTTPVAILCVGVACVPSAESGTSWAARLGLDGLEVLVVIRQSQSSLRVWNHEELHCAFINSR